MNQKLVVFNDAAGLHFYALVNVHTDDAFIHALASAAISDALVESQESWINDAKHVCHDGLSFKASVQSRLGLLGFKFIEQLITVENWECSKSEKSLLEVRLTAAGIAFQCTGGSSRHLVIPTKSGDIKIDAESGRWTCFTTGSYGVLDGSGFARLASVVADRGQEGVPF